ncbi:MAG: 50S ribosomal protein L6 [Candidatus Hydrogenedentes bacterium]|nr:50S ribosomal protein L6 [Candidatus Hydrogenedentota bacterium]
MSRIGKLPVEFPAGVKCELKDNHVKITGPKGSLEASFSPEITIALEDNALVVTRPSDSIEHRSLHGLTRTLINNMVVGVSTGFRKTLLIEGTGYRVSLQGKNLNLQVGHSHPVVIEPPAGITLEVEGAQTIHVSGIDRQSVGQVAANIRKVRPVEPYKGKGIRYQDEFVLRKESKAGA